MRMSMIKTPKQIEHIRKAAEKISQLLIKSLSWVEPGISTLELDRLIEDEMNRIGVRGACKGFMNYPCVSCLSVNDQVTHGIPDDTVLKEGDIIDVDLVIEEKGYYSDVSKTIGIGSISSEARRLIDVTEVCLEKGIAQAQPDRTLGDIGFAVQSYAESNGYSVVRDYTGHFIGLEMHEEPFVRNYGTPGEGIKLQPGMIFCIEPMINQGRRGVRTKGWDARTRDGKLSSRCEHMVLITEKGHEILTRHA